MQNNYRFIVIIMLTGVLYSCGVRKGLNGAWVCVYGSLPYRPVYANRLPEPNDTNQVTLKSDTLKPMLTRDTTSRTFISIAAYEKYLTVRGRNLEFSFSQNNTTASPILFRQKYLGKYKRRKGQIIATFNRIESVNFYDGSSTIVNCEERTRTFYYSKSTKNLYEIYDNDTTFYNKME